MGQPRMDVVKSSGQGSTLLGESILQDPTGRNHGSALVRKIAKGSKIQAAAASSTQSHRLPWDPPSPHQLLYEQGLSPVHALGRHARCGCRFHSSAAACSPCTTVALRLIRWRSPTAQVKPAHRQRHQWRFQRKPLRLRPRSQPDAPDVASAAEVKLGDQSPGRCRRPAGQP